MEEKIISFEEALKLSENNKKNPFIKIKRHLLLGNGFSINFSESFNYKNLSKKVDTLKPINNIKPIFNKLKTNNFEEVLFHLHRIVEVEKVIEIYDKDNKIVNQVQSDYEKIKSELIKIISDVHPDSPNSISKEVLSKAEQFFVSLFNNQKDYNLYTTNYDFIFYWLVLDNLKKKGLNFDDGFNKGEYAGREEVVWYHPNNVKLINLERKQNSLTERKQNLWYLHGALHLFEEDNNLVKLTNDENNLKAQITEKIQENKLPLFISEGKSEKKEEKIGERQYLQEGLESLKKIDGCLFTFGWSASEQDKHIINILVNNTKLKKLFIGFHNSIEEDLKSFAKEFEEIEVYFYNTQGIIK